MKRIGKADLCIPDCEQHLLDKTKSGKPFWYKYQWDVVDTAVKFVRDFSFAVDGGANVGLLSRRLAKWFDAVMAFEASAETFECLYENVPENVMCLNQALGEGCREVGVDRGAVKNTGARQIDPEGRGVEMVTLDSLELDHLGLLKLDVQGYETRVLRGGEETLQRLHPVCIVEVEESAKLPRTFGAAPEDALTYLQSLGAHQLAKVRRDHIMGWR